MTTGWATFRPEATAWYWESAFEPHREVLLAVVARYAPFRSILEVGCHCGPVHRRLRERFGHEFSYLGLDVNAAVIDTARAFALPEPQSHFAVADIATADLDTCQAHDLVISSGCLMCLPPGDLAPVLAQIKRIARTAFIAQEPTTPGCSTWLDGQGWAHPYPSWVVTC